MENFLVRFAGIDIAIQAEFIETKIRMKDYLISEGHPSFSVSVKEEDKKETLRQLKVCNGDDYNVSPSYLEFIALHGLISEQLLDYDVLLMHGSCLEFEKEGYIFTAASGTGKSTHSRIWRKVYGDKVRMINDDKPFLKCKEDEIIAYGSPWNGKERLGVNDSIKLKAIAYLERGEKNEIKELKPEEQFEKLYIQTYHSKDRFKGIKAMELLARITKNVKIYQLKCNMEEEAAIVSRQGMK